MKVDFTTKTNCSHSTYFIKPKWENCFGERETGNYFDFYSFQDLIIDNLITITHLIGRASLYKHCIARVAIGNLMATDC
jgi:hypothetical protein